MLVSRPRPLGVRAQRRALVVLALAIIVSVVAGSSRPSAIRAQGRPDAYEVHLLSRTFRPAPGIDRQVEAYLESLQAPRGHALVQTWGVPNVATRAALVARGVRLQSYLPRNTWIASVPADSNALHDLPGVRAVFPLRPTDKLAPTLSGHGVPPWAATQHGDAMLWVTYHADVDPDTIAATVHELGGIVTAAIPEARRLEVDLPVRGIATLLDDDAVQWLADAPPPKITANDGARAFVGLDDVQLPDHVWEGANVTVAEWDEGSVGDHADFEQRVQRLDAAVVSDHATHVAGSVLGAGVLRPSARGMAPLASLLSFDWNEPITEHAEAVSLGAVLSTNSWNYGASKRYNSCYGMYNYGAADYDDITLGRYGGQPVLVLFSAGNSQQESSPCGRTAYDKINVPATAKNIVTVGAVNSDDGSMTGFSSWGPTDDGRVKPEVVAPGCETSGDFGVTSTLPNDTYGSYCGTSMATPVTCGVAATLIERWRDTFADADPGTGPLPSTIKAALIATADDAGNAGPDFAFGYGTVNAAAAQAVLASRDSVADVRAGIGHGETHDYALLPDGNGPLKVSLVWSDVPAADNAAITLVNDLDLELVSPDATTVMPWILSPASPSDLASRGGDHTNVVELVEIAAPESGVWTARVSGFAVPQGPQSYSIVVANGTWASTRDVAVTALDVPPEVAAGADVQVLADVRNEGSFDESDLVVTLSDLADATEIGSQTVPQLLAGEVTKLSFAWSVPVDAEGERWLRAEVSAVPEESDITDNVREAATTVRQPVHDVAIASIAVPASAQPGSEVLVEARVVNLGDFAEDARVSASVSTDPPTDLGSESYSLSPGDGADATFTWNTAGVADGIYDITVAVEPVPGEDVADQVNNTRSDSVELSARATVRVPVTAGGDDVFVGCAFEPSLNEITMGEDACRDKPLITAGFRFSGLQVPNGADVLGAWLTFTSASDYTVSIDGLFGAEATDDADPFSSTRRPDDVGMTNASVAWSIDERWTYMDRVSSPDVAAVLQSIVSRPGWQAGNDVNIVLETTSTGGARVKHRRVFAYERSPVEAAELTVEFAP